MLKSTTSETTQTISIDQLNPGMYVKSLSDNKNLNIKSEGYISCAESITQLRKANITHLVIVPEKQKQTVNVEKVFAEIKTKGPISTKTKSSEKVERSLDSEMKKASNLYKNAKLLQEKILSQIKQKKTIKVSEVEESTNAMVDSIFRNQDALSCMSRLQTKDSYLIEHSLNVSILMSVFAKHLGFDKRLIQELALGAFLHDIGKVLLPNDILNKRNPLTDKEQNIIRSHVALGLKILESSPSISYMAINMIREHHERLDGSGYPNTLKGDEISKYGRMIAIIDSYDAMTSERPYKKSIHPINAFKTLIAEAPEYYDEELVENFIQCMGVYPVGTLVKLNSGKLGLISRLNKQKPLHPYVRVFYNIRMKQAIPIQEINLSESKYKDQIDCCIRPEEFNLNLLGFFKTAFID
ncbi:MULTISPECIES: HD-GYP domain-containing protein [unclassified Colwellia]|uniref:HD-GYP domain-containing protein n=1 Tax=unclassified Colwellia TaxID=196834 RepID=UPI0015F5D268|nr:MULTISPECIES: HD-GYP domain-containing protein [unclassified Colwellia]MBA6233455.1 HD-GYP domain-containing protein [Colwellia sp. MB02u-7]MBA6236545.1 HD-GYP domain-containing protein [Colwellia sp. MB02u-11]MBA6298056.1 HD-GYP domain-containing protein [Colwellia sp. MB3u-22]MBA6312120.1 HD-GYP domain-containing protein [Colwellia sp. MB3u-64]